MEDEKLILLVRSNECLFNIAHKDYSDSQIKLKIWRMIGEKLGYSGLDCKQRWFSLRDQFRRALRNKKSAGGETASKKKKWKYEKEMSFLLPYFQERDTLSNFAEENTEEDQTNATDGERGKEEKIKEEKVEEESISEQQTTNQSIGTENSSYLPEESRGAKFKAPLVHRTKRKRPSQADEAPSTALMRCVVEKLEKSKPSKHPLDAFMFSIGETIKTFPPLYQHMAKTKIFSVVSDIEMQLLVNSEKDPHLRSSLFMQTCVSDSYPMHQVLPGHARRNAHNQSPLLEDNHNTEPDQFEIALTPRSVSSLESCSSDASYNDLK